MITVTHVRGGRVRRLYAERFLRRDGLSTEDLSVTSEYEWAENPHRVGSIELHVNAPCTTRCTIHPLCT
jgi:hypothetical protein